MCIGAILKKRREQKRVSQQELADALGISQKTYSNIESDKSIPNIFQLYELSKILDFCVVDVFNEKGLNLDNSEILKKGLSEDSKVKYLEKLILEKDLRIQEKDEIISQLRRQM